MLAEPPSLLPPCRWAGQAMACNGCIRNYTRHVMFSAGLTYVAGETPVHRCDARVKILVLLAFSVGIFFISSWWALAAFAAAVAVACVVARLPLAQVNRMLVPVYVMGAFSVLFNVLASPTVEGLSAGLFLCVRMVVLVAASFVVCLTSSSTELLDAFCWFLTPLRRLGVPVDDIALTLALSLRFIPVIEGEFTRIRAAQASRGAQSVRSLGQSARIWAGAFTALFVGLFRHADGLAVAMDARCYGATRTRTRLPK